MKKALALALAMLLALSLVACGGGTSSSAPAASGSDASGSGAAAGDAIVIGGLAPLTGDAAQYGVAVNNGAMLAAKEINAAGGVMGRPIEFVLYDEKGDPTEAVNAYNRLVESDGIVALVGDVTTAPTIAVAQRAAQDGIPMITPTGTGQAITEIGDNIFRACFTDPYQGELMAHYAQEKLGALSAAILYDSGSDYSQGIAETFNDTAAELGLNVTAMEAYPTGTADFNAQLTRIKQGNPDVIMVPCYYEDAAKIIQQARDLGITAQFLGSDGWDGVLNQMDESNYAVLNGAYYCSQYSREDPSEALQAFMDTYRETYGIDENMFAVLGYEAMHLMAGAIETAGTTDADAVVAAMQNLSWPGLTGTISFNGGQDPARNAYIIEFVDGEEVVLGAYGFSDNGAAADASDVSDVSDVSDSASAA